MRSWFLLEVQKLQYSKRMETCSGLTMANGYLWILFFIMGNHRKKSSHSCLKRAQQNAGDLVTEITWVKVVQTDSKHSHWYRHRHRFGQKTFTNTSAMIHMGIDFRQLWNWTLFNRNYYIHPLKSKSTPKKEMNETWGSTISWTDSVKILQV